MKSTLLDKSFRILERIAAAPAPVTLKELAADLELNTSTVSRIASDLAERNLIRKAGYHSFVPSARLIRLGQAALDTPYLRNVSELLEERVSELGVNGLFAGLDAGHLVLLCAREGGGGEKKVPPLWDSPLAATILAELRDREMAESFFAASVSAGPPSPNTMQTRELFMQWYRTASEQGYVTVSELRREWSVNFPVAAGTDVYGLCLYGSGTESRNIDRMQFECSRLASRLSSMLNGLR
jgi:DNA-binding IclR family transcriptional regulator